MAQYTRNYLYIYITQAVSMLLGMLSLFIVIPSISSNKELYGIYSLCSSLTIFFSYADIGFVSAGQKFAAEAYIRGEREHELKILGFSGSVLFLFLFLISCILCIFAWQPAFLIKNINGDDVFIARQLLLILACSSPIFCFLRLSQLIYSIRLSDYSFQLMQIGGNVVKILSVFWFFGGGRYDIVGYYLNIQIISLLVVMMSYVVAKRKYNVSFQKLLSCFHFKKDIFNELKGLAIASLFGTICWILYYELDNIAISRLLGAEAVAIYAIAFSILSVFRSIFSMCFSPYPTRFNYFVGLKDYNGLNKFVKTIMEFFLPVVLIPIIVMSIVAGPFISTWVGDGYEESTMVLSCLLFCNVLAFTNNPCGLYVTALQKNRFLYISNAIIVIVFWGGVFISYKQLGVLSFAVMKAVGMIFGAIYSYIIVFKLMKESGGRFALQLIKHYLVPVLCCVGLSMLIQPFMFHGKDSKLLLFNIMIFLAICISSYLCFLPFSKLQRDKMSMLYNIVKARIKEVVVKDK